MHQALSKHFLENEGEDATPLFLFIHSSSCPPNSPLPTYEERNAHREQQAQFVTEVSHQQLALRNGATWARCMTAHGRYGFPSDLKIPNAKYIPAIKGIPTRWKAIS